MTLEEKLQEQITQARKGLDSWKINSFEETGVFNALTFSTATFQLAADEQVFAEALNYVKRQRQRQLRELAKAKVDVGIALDKVDSSPTVELMRRAVVSSWHHVLNLMDKYD